jgi:hypothetical protein
MRSLCWSSAAAVVLLLAGCGGAHVSDPYAYDHARPLAVRDQGVALSGPKVAMHVVSFDGARRVNAFLVVPRSSSCMGAEETARTCSCRRCSSPRAASSR